MHVLEFKLPRRESSWRIWESEHVCSTLWLLCRTDVLIYLLYVFVDGNTYFPIKSNVGLLIFSFFLLKAVCCKFTSIVIRSEILTLKNQTLLSIKSSPLSVYRSITFLAHNILHHFLKSFFFIVIIW